MNMLKFAKVNPEATIPTKRKEDAGYDIYIVPETYQSDGQTKPVEGCYLNPGQIKVFSTGIASAFDEEYVCELKDKSSLAAKGLHILGGVIDSGYRGEWSVVVINLGNHYVYIPSDKAIFTRVMTHGSEEISYEELSCIPSERQTGGFGSTNK